MPFQFRVGPFQFSDLELHCSTHHLLLPHVEFAYNKAPSKITGISPFKVVYGFDPLGSLDLVPRSLDQKPSANAED